MNAGLSGTEDIPREAETRHEVGVDVGNPLGLKPGSPANLKAGGSERINAWSGCRRVRIGEEAAHAALPLMPGEEGLVPEAIVEGEAGVIFQVS